ncbi:MAG TPA: hypothetical protein VF765_34520 [Polyangiaceae bacterium]
MKRSALHRCARWQSPQLYPLLQSTYQRVDVYRFDENRPGQGVDAGTEDRIGQTAGHEDKSFGQLRARALDLFAQLDARDSLQRRVAQDQVVASARRNPRESRDGAGGDVHGVSTIREEQGEDLAQHGLFIDDEDSESLPFIAPRSLSSREAGSHGRGVRRDRAASVVPSPIFESLRRLVPCRDGLLAHDAGVQPASISS